MKREWKRRVSQSRRDGRTVAMAHWIVVPPELPEAELQAAGRAALAARRKQLRDGDHLIFRDFWGVKTATYYMSEPLDQNEQQK